MNLLKLRNWICGSALIIGFIWMPVAVQTGCTTSSQRTAYNSIATVEGAASTAVEAYYATVLPHVANGEAYNTNQVIEVSKRFNQLQTGLKLAASASRLGTNSVAPTNLVQESADLVTFVTSITQNK